VALASGFAIIVFASHLKSKSEHSKVGNRPHTRKQLNDSSKLQTSSICIICIAWFVFAVCSKANKEKMVWIYFSTWIDEKEIVYDVLVKWLWELLAWLHCLQWIMTKLSARMEHPKGPKGGPSHNVLKEFRNELMQDSLIFGRIPLRFCV
jgi:hypothetical protein